MRRFVVSAAASLVLGALVFAPGSHAGYMGGGGGGSGQGKGAKPLLIFKEMYGVNGPFLGAANAVRGVAGDELPWITKKANGKLDSNGHLVINVKGLVFPDEPGVPEELRGINDEEEFRALVSCLTVDGDDVVEENVISDGFPATVTGNAKINARLTLPTPCVAPIVMILGGDEDFWFAMTGN
jgi:hypothetical protein